MDLEPVDYNFMKNVVGVTDVVPSLKFSNVIRDRMGQGPLEVIDLSGFDQLTDEVFVILKEAEEEHRHNVRLRRFVCVGCPYITDNGIAMLAHTFPSMEHVVLDGCSSLTEKSARHILSECTAIASLSMINTNVMTHSNILNDDRVIDFNYSGCPMIPQLSENEVEYMWPLLPRRCLIMKSSTCCYNFIGFIQSAVYFDLTASPLKQIDRSHALYSETINDLNIMQEFLGAQV